MKIRFNKCSEGCYNSYLENNHGDTIMYGWGKNKEEALDSLAAKIADELNDNLRTSTRMLTFVMSQKLAGKFK